MKNRVYYVGWLLCRYLFRVLFGSKAIDSTLVPLTGPVIVAANHQSYFDPPVLGAVIRREMHFFAKRELFGIFILGWLIGKTNAIPVHRGVYDPAALSRAEKALAEGGALIMFPEGTRDGGKEFLPPKPGIGLIAKRTKASIVPAYLYRTNKLFSAMFARRRVKVFFDRPIGPDEIKRFPDTKEGYQSLAEAVMERISRLKLQAVSA